MIRKRIEAAWLIAVAFIITAAGGCGYRFVAGQLGGDSPTPLITGPLVENSTRYPGLELILAEAIAHRFIVEKRPLHKPAGEASARLRCIIRSLDIEPVSYRRNLTAREYRITMTFDAALERQGQATAAWKAEGLTLIRTYRVRNTIDATEREKKAALETLSHDAAMMIADGILHGF